jgi:hypothetical protein
VNEKRLEQIQKREQDQHILKPKTGPEEPGKAAVQTQERTRAQQAAEQKKVKEEEKKKAEQEEGRVREQQQQ